MIKIDSVTKTFQGNVALNNVSLKLENGEITSIIGLNGAGKSTLISLIMNYKSQDSGTIERGSVSVMPDAECMIENMTGEEFINFLSGIKRINKFDKNQYLILAEKLFIKQDLKKKIKKYSFGMKKKLSFIQAYMGDFDTYIFDEPTSGVDVESARVMMALLKDLKFQGKAVLLTSHNIDELEVICDYIYVLKKGEILEEGTVEKIKNRSRNEAYTLKFVNPKKFNIEYLFHGVQYSLETGSWEEGAIKFYSKNLEEINLLLKALLNHEVVLKGFWVKTESLKESIFEKC